MSTIRGNDILNHCDYVDYSPHFAATGARSLYKGLDNEI